MKLRDVVNPIEFGAVRWCCEYCWGEGCEKCRGLGIREFEMWETLWFWAMSYFVSLFVYSVIAGIILWVIS